MPNTKTEVPDCPPAGANCLPLTVYRVAQQQPLADSDFLSWMEEIAAGLKNRRPPADPVALCRWHGLSLFGDLSDAHQHIALFGEKTMIAKADLVSADGVADWTHSKTFASHVTWWPIDGLDRKSRFSAL